MNFCQGSDALVSLKDGPDPNADFVDLLPSKILAKTNLIAAAGQAHIYLFPFASSAKTTKGYPLDRRIMRRMSVAIGNLYRPPNSKGKPCVRSTWHSTVLSSLI